MESATGAAAPSGTGPLPDGQPAGKPGSAWSLRLRVASGVLFVPLLVLLAHAGGMAFLAFVMLQVFLGVAEFYGMMRAKGLMPQRTVGLAAAMLLLASSYRPDIVPRELLVTFALLALLGFGLSRPQARSVESLAVTAFGVIYVGWLSAHLVLLRELPWQAGTEYAAGASFVLLAFFLTWSCDTGAYAFGRAFGKRPLWAEISPRKTVEGWLRYLQPFASRALQVDDFADAVYQTVHRAASACAVATGKQLQPELVYLHFHPSPLGSTSSRSRRRRGSPGVTPSTCRSAPTRSMFPYFCRRSIPSLRRSQISFARSPPIRTSHPVGTTTAAKELAIEV